MKPLSASTSKKLFPLTADRPNSSSSETIAGLAAAGPGVSDSSALPIRENAVLAKGRVVPTGKLSKSSVSGKSNDENSSARVASELGWELSFPPVLRSSPNKVGASCNFRCFLRRFVLAELVLTAIIRSKKRTDRGGWTFSAFIMVAIPKVCTGAPWF